MLSVSIWDSAENNFRNKSMLYWRFNSAVESYNQFLDKKSTAEAEDAYVELDNAGNMLGALCEHVVKNLVYQYYQKKYVSSTNTAERFQYANILQFKKSEYGKTKSLVFNELYGLLYSIYQHTLDENNMTPRQANINNYETRQQLVNHFKHNGESPKPMAFQKVLPEVRFLLKLVDPTHSIELRNVIDIESASAWLKLYAKCDYYRAKGGAYNYILVTDKLRNEQNQKELFKIPWSLILDFDFESELTNGLLAEFKKVTHDCQPHIHFLSDKPSALYSQLPHWVFMNGIVDDPKNMPQADMPLQRRVINRKLLPLIEAFHAEYYKPACVIVLGCDKYPKSTFTVLQALSSAYDDKDVYFHIIGNNDFALSGEEDFSHFTRYDMTVHEFILSLRNELTENISQVGDSKKLPCASSVSGIISEALYKETADYIEPVYFGIENSDEVIENSESYYYDFYIGKREITWRMLADEIDLPRSEWSRANESEIRKKLTVGGHTVLKKYYEPGLGGTTYIHRLAFDLHGDYPTVLVHNYIYDNTAKAIRKLYDCCKLPMLILIDGNKVSEDNVMQLQHELGNENFSFCIVYICRNSNGKTGDLILGRLKNRECNQLREKLLKYIPENANGQEQLQRLDACIAKPEGDEEHTPFVLSMYAFNREFYGIRNFVKNTLKEIANHELSSKFKKILFALALADWAIPDVPAEYFDSAFLSNESRLMCNPDYPIAPLIANNMDDRQSPLTFRIRYHLYSDEILRIASGSGDYISFLRLRDPIIEFIKSARPNPNIVANRSIVDLLTKMFVSRAVNIDGNNAKYSRLIERLVSEVKSYLSDNVDTTSDMVVAVLRQLVETFPEEAHFWGHLARYYFYSRHDYASGFEAIDTGLKVAKENNELGLTSLYHMKGMGYVVYITHELLGSLYSLTKKEPSESLPEIRKLVSEMPDKIAQACMYFQKARKANPDDIHAHVAECKMRINIQTNYFNLLSKYAAEYSIEALYPIDEVNVNLDQIDCLIEDAKSINVAQDANEKYVVDSTQAELVRQLECDRDLLKADTNETIELCKNFLNKGCGPQAQFYRRRLARAYVENLHENYDMPESQNTLKEAARVMEENIQADSANGNNIRIWFNIVRFLKVDRHQSLQILEEVLYKLNLWIESNNAPIEAYFYRYIAKFIQLEESQRLNQSDALHELTDYLDSMKSHCKMLGARTITQEWMGNIGYGLNRLIRNKDMHMMTASDAVKSLSIQYGRLPGKEGFISERSSYLNFKGNEVFFRPANISNRISSVNEHALVKFGLGFSYDGLRSYYDSIELVSSEEVEKVDFEVTKSTQLFEGAKRSLTVMYNNKSFVVGTLSNSGGILGIVYWCGRDYENSNAYFAGYEAEKFPEKGTKLEVSLIKEHPTAWMIHGISYKAWECTTNLYISST